MSRALCIGLIGDRDDGILAHRAIPLALQRACGISGVSAQPRWLPTRDLQAGLDLTEIDGLWCVPGSPYRSMAGALRGITHARERQLPFLGTCGGFQHALIEYARNCLGWADAHHAETDPGSPRALISELSCSLVDVTAPVRLVAGSRIQAAYGADTTDEGYHCRYGLNPEYQQALLAGPLTAGAHDTHGAVRAVELGGHPFFIATLFQVERAALAGRAAPLVGAFLAACAGPRPQG